MKEKVVDAGIDGGREWCECVQCIAVVAVDMSGHMKQVEMVAGGNMAHLVVDSEVVGSNDRAPTSLADLAANLVEVVIVVVPPVAWARNGAHVVVVLLQTYSRGSAARYAGRNRLVRHSR